MRGASSIRKEGGRKGTACYLEKQMSEDESTWRRWATLITEVIKAKRDGQKENRTERFSFILSALLSPLFVSSSTLCSEQGSQGHLAGCEAWG